jgi:hypothetical protein
MPHALALKDRGALLALGLHLRVMAFDDVARRPDVLQLDAGDLDPPRFGRLVDHDQQPRLISSRLDRVSSRSIDPMTVRKLVVESAMIAS